LVVLEMEAYLERMGWRVCVNHGIVLLVVEELCFAEVVRMNSFVLQGLEHIFPMAAR